MAKAQCCACQREFAGVDSFDAHQSWDYTKPQGKQLVCRDPATYRRKGSMVFAKDKHDRWTLLRHVSNSSAAIVRRAMR